MTGAFGFIGLTSPSLRCRCSPRASGHRKARLHWTASRVHGNNLFGPVMRPGRRIWIGPSSIRCASAVDVQKAVRTPNISGAVQHRSSTTSRTGRPRIPAIPPARLRRRIAMDQMVLRSRRCAPQQSSVAGGAAFVPAQLAQFNGITGGNPEPEAGVRPIRSPTGFVVELAVQKTPLLQRLSISRSTTGRSTSQDVIAAVAATHHRAALLATATTPIPTFDINNDWWHTVQS